MSEGLRKRKSVRPEFLDSLPQSSNALTKRMSQAQTAQGPQLRTKGVFKAVSSSRDVGIGERGEMSAQKKVGGVFGALMGGESTNKELNRPRKLSIADPYLTDTKVSRLHMKVERLIDFFDSFFRTLKTGSKWRTKWCEVVK
jgi:hypothetical protein